VADAMGGHERRGGTRSNELLLKGVVKLLPTPRTNEANGPAEHGTGGQDLRTAISLLPTPRASDGEKGGPNQRGSSGDLTLSSAVHRTGASTNPRSDVGNTLWDD